MHISAMFRDEMLASRDFEAVLEREFKIVSTLATQSPSMAATNWLLKGDSVEEANLYKVFDIAGKATPAALAVLNEEFRGDKGMFSFVAIWNGQEAGGERASMVCHVGPKVLPDRISLRIGDPACYSRPKDLVDTIRVVIEEFRPLFIEVFPEGYFPLRVFTDKPGVGWMLYLPQVITAEQVPEAQALIPVPAPGKKQTGTIIVSVADEVFSLDNPSHVDLANRIEMRLVDQDLLPRYADL